MDLMCDSAAKAPKKRMQRFESSVEFPSLAKDGWPALRFMRGKRPLQGAALIEATVSP
jgi:hypothetical protein